MGEPDRDADRRAGGEGEAPVRLFVYGTLRRSQVNPFAAVLHAHSAHLGAAWIRARLYALGWFPGAVASDDPVDVVRGDVFALHPAHADAVLARLDEYEGAQFERRETEARLETGETVHCWTYFYTGEPAGERIAGGDWAGRG
jgi:gamma-glutamylcyclotransferase (GGCT)/AIG2-like uncharacterized protein YtfP